MNDRSDEVRAPFQRTNEDGSISLLSGLRELTDEERRSVEFTPDEAAQLRARLDDIDRHTVLNEWWLR